ncbi:MAG: DNA repair protein RecO [Desulfobacterales bacterium]
METLTSPAVILRRVDYGDFDYIVTLFTPLFGKVAGIAKNAKKSRKRFGGMLDTLAVLEAVLSPGRRKGLMLLKEVHLLMPFDRIAGDVRKTAAANYWAEVVARWMEPQHPQHEIYDLLVYGLEGLNEGRSDPEMLNILFQARFLAVNGLMPDLAACSGCKKALDALPRGRVALDLEQGGWRCPRCRGARPAQLRISKGAIKQIMWLAWGPLWKVERMRMDAAIRKEAQGVLERFLPYHLGCMPRSLRFLKQLRT